MTPTPMQALITTLTEVFSASIDAIGDIAGAITSTPLLLLSAGFLFAGFMYSIFGKLLRNS